ncbi:hypothetical protein RB598_007167 [Gaeumannomyces tritici]
MQRMSLLMPSWDRTRSVDGKGNGGALSRVFGWADKTGASRRSTVAPSLGTVSETGNSTQQPPKQSKFGRETYWPSSIEKECEKAARILKSFCTDGFISYEPQDDAMPATPTTTTPPTPPPTTTRARSSTGTQIMKKIPSRIVQNAVGLAIFSCMRSGLWMSGSGGSGILIARKADGTWSTPSGILLHTSALGFVVGVDIYDCVLVINSVPALEMFTRARVTLGTGVPLTVGPVAPMGLLENDSSRWRDLDNTVLTYLKARGQHRAVNLDGSLVTERGNENEKFYGSAVDILDVLAGNVRKSVPEIAPLFEAIKAAEGRSDFDIDIMQSLAQQPAPGDATIETPAGTPVSPTKSTFGLPSADDPDPFGVIALEMAGLEIREAGNKNRPVSSQIDYSPSPTSPMFSNFNRQSVETCLSHSNRGSYMSNRTQATTVTDAFTQTDVGESTSPSPCLPKEGDDKAASSPEIAAVIPEPEEIDYTKIDLSALAGLNRQSLDASPVMPTPPAPAVVTVISRSQTPAPGAQGARQEPTCDGPSTHDEPASAPISDDEEDRDGDADDEDDEDDDEDEPIIFEVATAAQPARTAIMATQVTQVIQAKGALVTIPKRLAPALPERNPARRSRASRSDYSGDVSALQSPTRPSFDSSVKDEDRSPSPAAEAPHNDGVMESTPAVAQPHHRTTSSVYTAGHEMLAAPTTPLPMECSSADEESVREPQTPRLVDDIRPGRHQDANGTQNDMTLKPNNFNSATIEVV